LGILISFKMKRVIIVRHAKSVPTDYDNDIERDLTERGEEDAEMISLELKKSGISPGLMISSPAKRAKKTAEIFAKTFDYPKKAIRFEKKLYSGKTADNFLLMLRELEDELNTVFVFGHNPSVYYYMNYLMSDFTFDVPTCSTVAIDFNVDSWNDLNARSGSLGLRLIPDMFR
jgi:phosphohistidine phosphatase